MVVADDLIKTFSGEWWGVGVTGVDLVGDGQTKWYFKDPFYEGKK